MMSERIDDTGHDFASMAERALGGWAEIGAPAPTVATTADGVQLRRGDKVRLHPLAGGDMVDIALDGKVGIIEGIDQELGGDIHLSVTMEDDPGRDLGDMRYPAHRFFFRMDEIEPLPCAPGGRRPSILVAGIGNVFLGDDGFGVAVARRMSERALPEGVRVVDFGIRGLDLAYAMQDPYDAVIMVDAAPRGGAPGTLYVIDVSTDAEGEVAMDAHGMDPVKVLRLARTLGHVPATALVVGCEPETVLGGESYEDVLVELSSTVGAAIDEAVKLVERVIEEQAAAFIYPGGGPQHD
ncbi:MAG: hydrogenase maturation protease [Gemmatimonadaceae bacterium]